MWVVMYLKDFYTRTVVANALEYLLNVFHKAVVKDGLSQADVTEVALTFSRLATGLADLVWSGDTKTEVVRS
jgi:hypothetical protein